MQITFSNNVSLMTRKSIKLAANLRKISFAANILDKFFATSAKNVPFSFMTAKLPGRCAKSCQRERKRRKNNPLQSAENVRCRGLSRGGGDYCLG